MKANCSATSMEMFLVLTKDEINSLEKTVLKGMINMPSDNGPDVQKPLTARVGNSGHPEYKVYIETHPKSCNYLESSSYDIIISSRAYKELKQRGTTGERLYGVAKIIIFEKSKYDHPC